MNNLEKVKQEINNYQEEFKKSKEYLDLKQKDFALYKDKNLLPYFKQKEKIEEDKQQIGQVAYDMEYCGKPFATAHRNMCVIIGLIW